MIKFLIERYVSDYSFLNAFSYVSTRSAYGALNALLLSFIFGPKLISILTKLKADQEIRNDGPETHKKKKGTPTMGGLMMILSIVFSILLWADITNHYTWICVFSIIGFGLIGMMDDLKKILKKNTDGISAKRKLILQFLVSFIITLWIFKAKGETGSHLYIPFIKNYVLDLGYLYIPFGMLLLVASSNSVNLTDGLDGLATGLSIIVSLTFAILAYLSTHSVYSKYLNIPYLSSGQEVVVISMILLGALVGFLWYNTHPAMIMMGDTGSLFLGGLIGSFALLLNKEILLILIGGVFVLETLSVIIQVYWYKRTKTRVFKMAPIHHHFELSGWAETQVVTRFWIIGGILAIIALSTLKLQ